MYWSASSPGLLGGVYIITNVDFYQTVRGGGLNFFNAKFSNHLWFLSILTWTSDYQGREGGGGGDGIKNSVCVSLW